MILVELLVVLIALYVGARYGSLALGAISGIGIIALIFLGVAPGDPPIDVIFIIMSAVTCAAVMQAAGGTTWILQKAERILRKHPDRITVLAPICTFLLTIFAGTGHVVYTIMPVICDIALKRGIRPERPCAVASVASQVGIVCSPISVAVVSFASISASYGFVVTIPQILYVTIPACICGLLAASAASYRRGNDLDKDPDFLARLADPEMVKYMYSGTATTLDAKISSKGKLAGCIFAFALCFIVACAAFPDFIPRFGGVPVKMNVIIQLVLISAAGLMLVFCKADSRTALATPTWQNGMAAALAILGVAWLADSFFGSHLDDIKWLLFDIVRSNQWFIALVFFVASAAFNSQGAVVMIMMPLAYELGIPGPVLLGLLPSIYGNFFIPNYPSDIATVSFDRSGTTRIGKYLLNHSFMMPGLVSVSVSCLVASIISYFIY